MEKITEITSSVIPLRLRDVDTDMIIPANFLTSVSREGYGQNVFRRLRDADENFPFNQQRYAGAQVLVVDHNFGCGSSREHAVWALTGWGIKVVIGKSFADIFHGNSGKNGLLLVTLPEETVDQLLDAAEGAGECSVTVSLEQQTVTLPDGKSTSFEIDPFRKHCLLSGLDDADYILSHKDAIDTFLRQHQQQRFFSSLEPNH